jgi:hypothetical protein
MNSDKTLYHAFFCSRTTREHVTTANTTKPHLTQSPLSSYLSYARCNHGTSKKSKVALIKNASHLFFFFFFFNLCVGCDVLSHFQHASLSSEESTAHMKGKEKKTKANRNQKNKETFVCFLNPKKNKSHETSPPSIMVTTLLMPSNNCSLKREKNVLCVVL